MNLPCILVTQHMIQYPSCFGEVENLKIELIILHAERSGKSSDLYLEGVWFDSWPGH
jgi:hypothetical protein